jgi:hypothetical protein
LRLSQKTKRHTITTNLFRMLENNKCYEKRRSRPGKGRLKTLGFGDGEKRSQWTMLRR